MTGPGTAPPRRPAGTPVRRVPAGRYGRPGGRVRRWASWLAVGLVAACAVALIAGLGWRAANPAVSDGVLGYRVTSAHAVRLRFTVQAPRGRAADCTVQALALSGGVLGTSIVGIPPGTGSSRTYSVVVHTARRAIGAQVADCRLAR
jgi:hypothetical protein